MFCTQQRKRIWLITMLASIVMVMTGSSSYGQTASFREKIGAVNPTELGYAIDQTSDGGFIIGGISKEDVPSGTGPVHREIAYLVKLNSDGLVSWSHRYELPYGPGDPIPADNSCLFSVRQAQAGGYILAGYYTPPGQKLSDMLLIKTDNFGNLVWISTFGDVEYSDAARSVDWVFPTLGFPQPGYIVAGDVAIPRSAAPTCGQDIALIRTDANGAAIWTSRANTGAGLPPAHSRVAFGHSVQQARYGGAYELPNAGYIVAGEMWNTILQKECPNGYCGRFNCPNPMRQKLAQVKFDNAGNILWYKTYADPNGIGDVGYSVRQLADDGFVTVGSTNDGANNHIYLVRTNSNGGVMFAKRYHLQKLDNEDWEEVAYSVRIAVDGGFLIAGTFFNPNVPTPIEPHMFLLKTSGTGAIQWARRFQIGHTAHGVVVTSDQKIALAGFADNGGLSPVDIAAVNYSDACENCEQTELTFIADDVEPKVADIPAVRESISPTEHDIVRTDPATPMFGDCDRDLSSTAPSFEVTFAGDYNDSATCGQQIADGGYIEAGNSTGAGRYDSMDVFLVRSDTYGHRVWSQFWDVLHLRHPGEVYTGTPNFAYDIQEVAADEYIIAGGHEFENFDKLKIDTNLVLLKAHADNTSPFCKSFGMRTDDNTSNDVGKSVRKTADGGYIVAGYSNSRFGYGTGPTGYNAYVIKTSSTGALQWGKAIGGALDDYATCAVPTDDDYDGVADDGYIVVGHSKSFTYLNTDWDIFVVKLDNYGSIVWSKTYGGSDDEFATEIQQTGDKGFIITGYAYNGYSMGRDVVLLKIDLNGNKTWYRRYDYGTKDIGASVRQAFDGYYVGGMMSTTTKGDQAFLMKTDCDGVVDWVRLSPSTPAPGVMQEDKFGDIDLTSDGGVVGFGTSRTLDPWWSQDFYMVKLDRDGDGCNDDVVSVSRTSETWDPVTVSPSVVEADDEEEVVAFGENGGTEVSYCSLGKRSTNRSGQTIGASGATLVMGADEGMAADVYPVPVTAGEMLTIELMLRAEGRVSVTVSDVAGHVVKAVEPASYREGRSILGLDTQGFAPGTYVVKMSGDDGASCVRRIVVSAR